MTELINDTSKINQLLGVIQNLENSLRLSAKLSVKDTNRENEEKFSPLLKIKQKRTSENFIFSHLTLHPPSNYLTLLRGRMVNN